MNIQKIKYSLFWRLSVGLLILLILLGISYVLITASFSRKYYQETTQRLNSHVAEHLLLEVNPFINGKVNEDALGKIMHSMMAVNPGIEVYLLDPQGEILSFVVLDKDVRLKNVNISPVKEFVDNKGENYILGDDPRLPGNETVFSAAPVFENDVLLGYVYMVLASEKYTSIAEALASSYFIKIGTFSFILTLIAALTIGLILLYFLTRNLRKIIETVKQFANGDFKARIPVSKSDELSAISITFNKMADTIEKNMDELKQVDSLRRELIANVSHDLRSPLAVIHGYIETMLIKEGKLTEDERKKYLDIILKSSEKLNKLVGDLFELSMLESKQVEMKKEHFNIHEYLLNTKEEYALIASNKNLNIEMDVQNDLPPVFADIHMMQRVIQNLIENALKYTPENGSIKIKVEKRDEKLELEFTNSGPGIAQNDLPHLFERYFKNNKETSNQKATGLGLAIVKKILDFHKTNIQVKSEQNSFTTFSFNLPVIS